MPRAIAAPIREAIVARHLAGLSLPQIASELGLPWATVRTLWRRYRDRGAAELAPAYAGCGRRERRFPPALAEAAATPRRAHPGWGAGLIRPQLGAPFPAPPLPHERTVRRWLAEAGVAPTRRSPRPPDPPRATGPHVRWRLDACAQVRLADGSRVSWLAASDEATDALLGATVFPRGRWNRVDRGAVQTAWRAFFARWGLSDQLRVDNGSPWGSWGELPPDRALGLLGLGVALLWNRPRHGQANGGVERAHGLGQRWVEPARGGSAQAWPTRLDWALTVQRATYPAIAGQNRLTADPALATPRRPTIRRGKPDRGSRAASGPIWPRSAGGDAATRWGASRSPTASSRSAAPGPAPPSPSRSRGSRAARLGSFAPTTARAAPPTPDLGRGRIRRLTVAHRRSRPPKVGQPHDREGGQPYSR